MTWSSMIGSFHELYIATTYAIVNCIWKETQRIIMIYFAGQEIISYTLIVNLR